MKNQKLTKKRYSEFYSALTGHSKSYVLNHLEDDFNNHYRFITGMQMYHAWIVEGKIYCQFFLDSACRGAWYFDIDTFEHDWKRTEQDEDDNIEEIIYSRMNN